MQTHITVRDVALRLGCCEETVRRLIRSGALPALRLGQQYRVDQKTLELSLSSQRNKSQQLVGA
jgi:excisionase family DNA binding protein